MHTYASLHSSSISPFSSTDMVTLGTPACAPCAAACPPLCLFCLCAFLKAGSAVVRSLSATTLPYPTKTSAVPPTCSAPSPPNLPPLLQAGNRTAHAVKAATDRRQKLMVHSTDTGTGWLRSSLCLTKYHSTENCSAVWRTRATSNVIAEVVTGQCY